MFPKTIRTHADQASDPVVDDIASSQDRSDRRRSTPWRQPCHLRQLLRRNLAKADPAPAITAQATESKSAASAQDLYLVCAFYPKPGTCEAVYRQAMHDNSISAEAVRDEYSGYARYLNGAAPLTEADRQFLRDNGIRVPEDLNPANQTGLHNVINDASLSVDAKRTAVNNFLSFHRSRKLFHAPRSHQKRIRRASSSAPERKIIKPAHPPLEMEMSKETGKRANATQAIPIQTQPSEPPKIR